MDDRDGLIEDMRGRAAAAEAARLALHASVVTPIGATRTRKGRRSREGRERAVAAFHAAVRDAYPSGFWEVLGAGYERLAAGERDAVEIAVLFLEADPWFFRSGYVKEDLLRRLKRLCLTADASERLRAVLLAAVDLRDRREFRRYCHLARALDAPDLRQALAGRRTSPDAGVRRRAEWMLAAVEGRPVDPELETARSTWRDTEALERENARGRHLQPVRTVRS